MYGPHLIDYTKLASYKKLIKLVPEDTGKIQAKRGTIRFTHNAHAYHVYDYGGVSKNQVKGSGTQKLISIPSITERTAKDYTKAFNEIIFKVEGGRHKAKSITKWPDQMYQAKGKVLDTIFNNEYGRKAMLKYLFATQADIDVNPWAFGGRDKANKFIKWPFFRRLHYYLKNRGIIVKGRDYE